MGACTNDACLPVKKTILATKEIMEEVFQQLQGTYPALTIEKTYTMEDGEIAPKIGIFPSSILCIPSCEKFPQPLKMMLFINVLNAQEKEVEVSYGWTFGPGADKEEEAIYIKLLDVVFLLKQKQGAVFKGTLAQKAEIQATVQKCFDNTCKAYNDILENID